MLFRNQVLKIGHLYTVSIGDSLSNLARRFGTSERSISFLNYELGELHTTNITIGQELCLIANSCFGEIQSSFDQHLHPESLQRWYEGVTAAYDALRKAKAEARVGTGRRMLSISSHEEGGVDREKQERGAKLREMESLLSEMIQEIRGETLP